MINFKTVAFMKMLDVLSRQTRMGYIPLSEFSWNTTSDVRPIVYDDSKGFEDGGDRVMVYPICRKISENGEVVSYWGDEDFNVHLVDDGQPFVEIVDENETFYIMIEGGEWHIRDCDNYS